MSSPLEAIGLTKTYVGGDGRELTILRDVDFRLEAGEAVAITGQSGAGKSTLLHLLGGLDRPTAGEVLIGGQSVGTLQDETLAGLRNREVGFVFQFHHLLREFTALENVMMPALIGGADHAKASARGLELLADVGLAERTSHKPRALSGGEQQRVAVARALVNDPAVLLADEPSGNLDNETSAHLHELLFDLRRSRNLSLIVVTHNVLLAAQADRNLVVNGGGLHPASAG